MSYQFEDESALEELLNQQLDRRKSQAQNKSTVVVPSRPGTSTGGARQTISFSSQKRPSTAASSGQSNRATRFDDTSGGPSSLGLQGSGPVKSKLSAWLEGDSGVSSTGKRSEAQELLDEEGQSYVSSGLGGSQLQRNQEPTRLAPASQSGQMTSEVDFESLLTAAHLQEMSKQRLIQLILERIVPELTNLAQDGNRQHAHELERLQRDLQAERSRLQVVELRHEEQLKLEQQRAAQVSSQLESRLELNERELAKLMDSQRGHLERLDEQHKRNMAALSENYEQRLREERSRFEEALKTRDEMHRLEMDSRLNVSCNLTKLDTIQAEWRRSLEGTIGQLEAHLKSVESLLDKQTLQVRGTNTDLATKTEQLCDQYDKLEQCNRQLTSVAKDVGELIPGLAKSQHQGEALQAQATQVLGALDEKLGHLGARERHLDELRVRQEEERTKLEGEKLKLALDSARVQMKEERLDELIKSNAERELVLASERSALSEQSSQAQIKRVSLDERAADLKEQNYTLHLLRKRLTHQREELLRAQASFAEERKLLKSERSQMATEMKRLAVLRTRVQRELEQLRRLQRSLVCSLCLGRLFGGHADAEGFAIEKYEQPSLGLQTIDVNERTLYDEGQLFGRLARNEAEANGDAGAITALFCADGHKTMPSADHARVSLAAAVARHNGNDLDLELRQTELESDQLAAESKYAEQLRVAS